MSEALDTPPTGVLSGDEEVHLFWSTFTREEAETIGRYARVACEELGFEATAGVREPNWS